MRHPPVVLFDLDNTLVDRQAAFEAWARAFAEAHGLGEPGTAFLRQVDDDGFAPRERVFEAVRRRFGLVVGVEELIAGYRASYPDHFRPEPAVQAALVRLRGAGWRIGLVTNGPPTQREKLERAGLAELVDQVCISEELGVAKPDRRIFEEAFRRLKVPSEGVWGWMVGDAALPDIAGGSGAGLGTVWVHRGRAWEEPGFRPDAVVAGCVEAVDLLLSGGAHRRSAGSIRTP